MSMYLRSFVDFLRKKIDDLPTEEDKVFGIFYTKAEINAAIFEAYREYCEKEED